MNRRSIFTFTAIAALGLALVAAILATPRTAFAQADPLLGLWSINTSKSKFNPGPAPKSQTIYVYMEGQNRKVSAATINAAGTPGFLTAPFDDGQTHQVIATPAIAYDAATYTKVDANTANFSRTKAGKVVQTGTRVVSQDGKTLTLTTTGTDADGHQINNVAVYDREDLLRPRLIGHWELASCEQPASGPKLPYCGGNATGSLSLHGNGHYTLVILANGRPKEIPGATGSTLPDRTSITPDYYKSIAQGAVAQFGTWSVNEADKTLTRHTESAFFPGGNGQEVKFSVSLNGDELKVGGAAGNSTTWKRAR